MCALDASKLNDRHQGKMREGNSVLYFQKLRSIISVNDGVRKCGDNIVQVSNSQPPFNYMQKTQMKICDSTFHITSIDKSYAIINVDVAVRCPDIGTITDPEHLLKIFVGFKNSAEALRQTDSTSNGRDTGYQSNCLQWESFAYNTYKSEAEKKRKRGVHTLYEDIWGYSQSICGAWINLVELVGGATAHAIFDICIPFTNLLVFSFFSYLGKFPSFIADIILKDVYLGYNTLCWALASPKEVKETKEFLEGTPITKVYKDLSTIQFEHRPHQIDDPSFIPISSVGAGTDASPITYTSGTATLICSGMTVNQWKSHIKGYMISEAAQAEIVRNIQEMGGLVFPAQECKYIQFNNAPTSQGLKIQVNTALFNTTSIIVGFPKTSHEITCLQNPSQTRMQLKLNNVNIPNEGFDTHSVAHLKDQMGTASLDGPLNCTRDFENSVMLEHNQPDGTRWGNALTDDTSYLCQFQCERSDAAFVIDGINTGGQNVPIELNSTPKYSGAYDTYYYPVYPTAQGAVPEPNTNRPFMLEVRDTFWVLDLQGLHYFSDKLPRGSQADQRMEVPR
jgi:hypothetical protein